MADPASSQPVDPALQGAVAPVAGRVNMVGIRLGYGMGTIAWLACFIVAAGIGRETAIDATTTALNILVCLFGSIVGWWFGILMSPDPTERGQFSTFRKAVSAFLSGFVLAKVDMLFQGAVAQNLTNSPLFMGRIGLFATTALICAQFTYVARHDLGMYGVRHFSKDEAAAAASKVATPTLVVHVKATRGQRWLRFVGVALALLGIGLILYVGYLHNLALQQNIAIVMLMAGALALLAATTTARVWLYGEDGSDTKPSDSRAG